LIQEVEEKMKFNVVAHWLSLGHHGVHQKQKKKKKKKKASPN
jgi:hypothetical protein